MIKNNRKLFDVLIIIVLCVVMMLPFLNNSVLYTGVDMGFHLNRAFDQYKIFKSGHFYSPINTFSLNHLGTPVNMVYGFLYLYPLAFWMLFIHNYVLATYLGIITILVIIGIVAYWIGNKFWKNKNKALAFSVLYTFSAYTFDIFFGSFSLAQASAMAFLPCVAYGTYSIFFTDKKDWLILSLGMSGTIYCHLVSTLIYSSLIVSIIVIAFLFKKININNLVTFGYSVITTLFITSFFWLNFLTIYLKNHSINTPVSSNISGYSVSEFTEALLNSILGLVITICFIIVLLNWEKLDLRAKMIGILSLVYIFISIDISNVFWHFFNKTPIKHIQGVIRFRVLITFLILVCIISASNYIFKNQTQQLLVIASLICITWLSNCYAFINNRNQNNTVSNYYVLHQSTPFGNYRINNNKDFEETTEGTYGGVGNLDYWPSTSLKNSNSLIKGEILLNHKEQIIPTKPIYNGVIFHLKTSTNEIVKLPFFIYNGLHYNVLVNGNDVKEARINDGCLKVKVNKGNNVIKVQTRFTNLQKIFACISIISFILLLIILVINGKRLREAKNKAKIF